MTLKVLHITNWYPHDTNRHEGLFIKKHIEALAPFVDSYFVLHLDIKPATRFKFHKRDFEEGIERRIDIPFNSWFLTEIVAVLSMLYYLIKLRHRNFDIINVHIAYPLMTWWHVIKRWITAPVIITEHWSAYHFNFGLPASVKLQRIKRIFRQNIPVITVSNSLADDIRKFARTDFTSFTIPNVVDKQVFYPDESLLRQDYFFMVSQWKWPKRPLVVFEAFEEFVKSATPIQLWVAGYGPDYTTLQRWVDDHQMGSSIKLLGSLIDKEIAGHLRNCKAFVHCSEYETFSVVCAEAVCCHTPVLASKVGGIPEVVGDGEGILMDSMDAPVLAQGMHRIVSKKFISHHGDRFSKQVIGMQYFQALTRCIHGV